MTILTGGGSFAQSYLDQFAAEVASIRELGEAGFLEKLSKATTIIHNAATIASNDTEMLVARNFDFTRFIVLKLQELNPSAHLIVLSSMSVLDPGDDQKYGNVLAMTPYAYSKYLAETYALKSELKHVSCVRFSTLFFKDPAKDGLSKLIADAAEAGRITTYNKGEALRNFLPIEVAVQYVQKITSQQSKAQRTYTLAAPEPTSFAYVAKLLKQQVPELVIEDKTIDGSGVPVLANFSTKDIDELGRIDFSLEAEIKQYLGGFSK
ncbi:MAG TPA: NAD-dependent epimerase/dehydratase family protein [Candidatus Saccharimonadales bacterium]|nr:NAD-dependent epimerase/dehydratase family protein [Candidatus Saccharimonadales bacterium]